MGEKLGHDSELAQLIPAGQGLRAPSLTGHGAMHEENEIRLQPKTKNPKTKPPHIFPTYIDTHTVFRAIQTKGDSLTLVLQQPFYRICCSFPIEEQSAHARQPHSAQKAGKDPEAEPQSHIRLRHLSSSPFPTSPHLPKPFPTEEQWSLCVKLTEHPREAQCLGKRLLRKEEA